jgi:hypothetical protein
MLLIGRWPAYRPAADLAALTDGGRRLGALAASLA